MLNASVRTRASRHALAALCALAGASASAEVAPHAGMLRFPGVSASHIAFIYANDIWIVPRAGGQAVPLASPPGLESFPRFSPDGKTLAFVGNYDGNRDLYTIPVDGGTPTRTTHHPGGETLCGWTPDGKDLLFFTNALAGRNRIVELFTVSAGGGMPTKLPVPYGANGAISPDGQWLAYTPHTIDTRTWKRYRGGMATAVWLFNLKDFSSKKITDWEGMCTLPMWHKDVVYYLADEGEGNRLNIWAYDTKTSKRERITAFTDDDVKWPSIGPGDKGQGEIVFQLGDELRLLDLATRQSKPVLVTIPGDRPKIRDRAFDVSKGIAGWSISPTGKRAIANARGDIWSLPAEKGSPRNLTRTSGIAERDPQWSPDGKWIAYFCDSTGEYELCVRSADGKGEPRQLTKGSAAFKLQPVWSPDSKKIAYTEKTGTIFLVDAESGEQKKVDRDPWSGGAEPISVSWSHDSRWLAYAKGSEDNFNNAVWIYSVESGEAKQATSDYFNSTEPVFDRKGEYLFFVSNRAFRPFYGEVDSSFIYAGTEVIAAVPLKADTKSPWAPTSDEEKPAEKKEDKDKKNGDKKDDAKKDDASKDEPKKDDAGKDEGKKDEKKAEPAKEAAPDDGVSGTWEGTITGGPPMPPGGAKMSLTLNIGKDGSVNGSFSTPMGSGSVSGTFDAATKAISLTLNIPGGPAATLTGSIAGGTLKATVAAPEMGFSGAFEGARTASAASGGGKDDSKKDDTKAKDKVEIDFEGFEARAMMLPIKSGNFTNLAVNDKNDLLYVRGSFRGSDDTSNIKIFSLKDEKKEEKNVAAGSAFAVSADGKKILIEQGGGASLQDASAGATAKPVSTSGMTATISPREEWKQIFADAWRIQRDYFYVENMHNVDWPKQRERYGRMIADCNSREDVAYVISEMISELNVGHAYYNGGDVESPPSVNVGLLGCDYELKDGAYRISRILRGAAWDIDAKGPLTQPGVGVKEGQFLLAVNGVPIDAKKDPWASFIGLGGKTVTITVSDKPTIDDTAKDIIVETLTSEEGLRYRAWIEAKRAYVAEKSAGQIGYIYVSSTGIDGQTDLFRQFYGQRHLPALLIDERWNSGGQIPTRFVELLNRPRTNYWARRDGADWAWPQDSHQGPKAMLMNGLSGSGGDAFPYYFRQAKLGKLIGTRTWGGLVGISGNPGLIDGGSVTVPTFGFYKLDGNWGIEGHGVDPDIEVIDDPALMVKGSPRYAGIGDPQIDAAIAQLEKELKERPYTPPARPKAPDRKGMGIPAEQR